MDLSLVSRELTARGEQHVFVTADTVVAAANFKISASVKLPAGLDHGMLSVYEGRDLRNRVSFTDITTTKLLNFYKKTIERTIEPRPHMHDGISGIQAADRKTILSCSQYGGSFGAPDKIKLRYEVTLKNEHNEPVYTKDDITPKMTLVLTEAKEG